MPHGWDQVKLETVLLKTNYGHTASSSQAQIGPRFLRITDLRSEGVNWETVPYCECDQIDKYALAEGDIVVARTGATTGKSFLIRGQVPDAIFASYLIRLRTSEGYEPEFLQLFMQSPNYWSQIMTARTGTAQPGVNATKLGGLEVPVPPANEQHRIVAKIESLFERSQRAKEALGRIPALLDKLRQSILAAAFRGDLTADWRAQNPDVEPADKLLQRIRTERRTRWEQTELAKLQAKGKEPKDDKWKAKYKEPEPINGADELFSLPLCWRWVPFEQLTTSLRSGTSTRAENNETDWPVLRSSAVRHGTVDFSDVRYLASGEGETYNDVLRSGDLLFTRLSGTLDYVGNCAAVRTVPSRAIYFPDRIFQARLVDSFCPGFLELAFSARELRAALERSAKSTAGHQRISLSDLRKYLIPVPSLKEQQEIVEKVQSALKFADSIAKTVTVVGDDNAKLQQSILAKAFRGELVPQDPNDEPASVLLERIHAAREAAKPVKPVKKTRTKRRVGGKKNAII